MIPIHSSLENREEAFDQVRNTLQNYDFTLGGNWDYEQGCFDKSLDEAHKVWLRIPFQVTHGALDGNTDTTDAIIRMGQPFVLKHLYNEGLDKEAQVNTFGALFNQFQEPVDQDASIEDKWVSKAKKALSDVEKVF